MRVSCPVQQGDYTGEYAPAVRQYGFEPSHIHFYGYGLFSKGLSEKMRKVSRIPHNKNEKVYTLWVACGA